MVKISVVMPVYNTPVPFLQEAVDSILNQTYQDFEFIIIDDGSDGDCKEYLKNLQDPRIRLIRNPENIGITKSLNIGFREAKGKYIARMDSDDISMPERLEKQFAFMESHQNVIMCGTRTATIGKQPPTAEKPNNDMKYYRVRMLFCNPGPSHPTAFFDREKLVQHHIIYDEQLTYAQDYGLYAVICQYGDIHILPEVLVYRRSHPGQITKAHRNRQIQCDKITQRKLLMLLLDNVTDNELDMHYHFSAGDNWEASITPEILQWYDRLLSANKIKRIYDQKTLKQFIIRIKSQLIHQSFSNEMTKTGKILLLFRYLPFLSAAHEIIQKLFQGVFVSTIACQFIFIKGRLKSYFNKPNTKEEYPIDFVVTWVDGNDADWQREKEKYSCLAGKTATDQENPIRRYRNWEFLQYWFRAIEKYAPWVHAIYFITCGQKPEWLKVDNKKIRFVAHEEFIPSAYLPTFCSDVIELNLYRIKELSEHFVYFNDDMFLNRPVHPEDFFENGLPKLHAVAEPIHMSGRIGHWQYRLMNNYAAINASFDIRSVIQKNPEIWFSHIIKSGARYNRMSFINGYIAGMRQYHEVMPFLKSAFHQVWQEYYSILDETSKSKFRTHRDVTIYLPQLWMIFQGKFVNVQIDYWGENIELEPSSIDRAVWVLSESNSISVCLNDGDRTTSQDFEMLKGRLKEAFEDKFPEKSSFER